MAKLCPKHLREGAALLGLSITCTAYSSTGAEILASYNDELIYEFSAEPSTSAPAPQVLPFFFIIIKPRVE